MCKSNVQLLILVLVNVDLTISCTLVDGVVYGVSNQIINVFYPLIDILKTGFGANKQDARSSAAKEALGALRDEESGPNTNTNT